MVGQKLHLQCTWYYYHKNQEKRTFPHVARCFHCKKNEVHQRTPKHLFEAFFGAIVSTWSEFINLSRILNEWILTLIPAPGSHFCTGPNSTFWHFTNQNITLTWWRWTCFCCFWGHRVFIMANTKLKSNIHVMLMHFLKKKFNFTQTKESCAQGKAQNQKCPCMANWGFNDFDFNSVQKLVKNWKI